MKNFRLQSRTKFGIACMACALLVSCMTLPSAASAAAGVATTAWKQVSNRTACEAMNPAACVGMYGFAVNDHGHFIVGPNPHGKTLEGEVTAGEFAQLKRHADAVAVDVASDPVGKCESGRRIMGTADTITITVGAKTISIKDELNKTCTYNGDSENTQQLVSDIHQLSQKYYVTPF